MKKCKFCQTEIDDKAKVCPNCKKDLRIWFARHPVWTIIIGLVIIGMIGSGASKPKYDQTGTAETSSQQVTVKTEEPQKPDLEVLEHKLVKESYSTKIVGKVRNNTDKTYGYAQVEINLYDKENALIGSTMSNINNFEAGTTWKFEAIVLRDEDVASYKIKDVTGF